MITRNPLPWLILAFLWLTPVTAEDEAPTDSKSCQESGFNDSALADLMSQDPRIGKWLVSLAEATNQKEEYLYLTNCRVSWPVNQDVKPIDGYRVVVMNRFWQTNNGATSHERGLKLVYQFETQKVGMHRVAKRQLRGYADCYGPDACAKMYIPAHPSDLKPEEMPHVNTPRPKGKEPIV